MAEEIKNREVVTGVQENVISREATPGVVKPKVSAAHANDFDFVMKRFKKQSSGVISEVKERAAYIPPSLKRKKKSEAARRLKNKKKFGNRW